MSPARLIAGLCLSIALISPGLVAAQETTPTDTQTPTTTATETPTNDTGATSADGEPLNSSNYKAPQNADYAVMNLMHAALCQIAGQSITGSTCLANVVNSAGETQLLSFSKVPGGGAIGSLTGVMAGLYTQPTSSAQYLAEVGGNLGIIKPTYAQSTLESSGGRVIQPVLGLWRFTQRIAYLAFVIVFLLVGFMIMLRRKMNPQTVISIQNALPGLVVGLIMVTFSYFICAFIVDLSFVGMQVVAGIFSQQANVFGKTVADASGNFDLARNQENLSALANNSNIFDFLGYTIERYNWGTGSDSQALTQATNQIVENTVGRTGALIIGLLISGLLIVPASLGGWALVGAGGGTGALAGNVVGALVPLIFIIALAVQLFRLVFALIGAYIQILLATVFGPFYILVSAIPGQGKQMSNWIRGLVANVLIFPAVFALFLFAGAILATSSTLWGSPPPFFGSIPVQIIPILIAYGIMLAAPSVPDAVRGAFGIKGQDNLGKAAVAGFLGGYTFAQSGVNSGYQRFWRGGADKGEASIGAVASLYNRARGRVLQAAPPDPNNPRAPRITWAPRPGAPSP